MHGLAKQHTGITVGCRNGFGARLAEEVPINLQDHLRHAKGFTRATRAVQKNRPHRAQFRRALTIPVPLQVINPPLLQSLLPQHLQRLQ